MNPESELERDLHAALRRREPPRDLLPGILSRLAEAPPAPRPARWRPILALAAALIVVAALGLTWRQRQQVRRQERARAAAVQLTRALRLASADLQRVQLRLRASD